MVSIAGAARSPVRPLSLLRSEAVVFACRVRTLSAQEVRFGTNALVVAFRRAHARREQKADRAAYLQTDEKVGHRKPPLYPLL